MVLGEGILVMEESCQSRQVNSVDEFKKLFLDVAHGYLCAYERAGVLHRDPSINNIMFSRRGGQVSGIHCDRDLEMIIDEASDRQAVDDAHVSSASVAGGTSLQPRGSEVVGTHKEDAHVDNNLKPTHKVPHRSGTGPYMAIDLLISKKTPKHLYRHDLESFFFIAAWFCAAFIPEEHTYDYQHEILKTWEEGTFRQIGEAKLRILDGETHNDLVIAAAKPYQVLLNRWVCPLLKLFFQINVVRMMVLVPGLRMQLFIGEITMTEFEKEIEKIEQERASIINYDEFIKALQVPST